MPIVCNNFLIEGVEELEVLNQQEQQLKFLQNTPNFSESLIQAKLLIPIKITDKVTLREIS